MIWEAHDGFTVESGGMKLFFGRDAGWTRELVEEALDKYGILVENAYRRGREEGQLEEAQDRS